MRDHVTFDDERDWNRDRHGLDAEPPLSLQDLAVIFGALLLAVSACLILGFAAMRADRPMVCQSLDLRGAECVAAITARL